MRAHGAPGRAIGDGAPGRGTAGSPSPVPRPGLALGRSLPSDNPITQTLGGTGGGPRGSGTEIRKGPRTLGPTQPVHFVDEETEAQRGAVTGPGSQTWKPELLTCKSVLLGALATLARTAAGLWPVQKQRTGRGMVRKTERDTRRTSQNRGRRSGNGLLLGLYFLLGPIFAVVWRVTRWPC